MESVYAGVKDVRLRFTIREVLEELLRRVNGNDLGFLGLFCVLDGAIWLIFEV